MYVYVSVYVWNCVSVYMWNCVAIIFEFDSLSFKNTCGTSLAWLVSGTLALGSVMPGIAVQRSITECPVSRKNGPRLHGRHVIVHICTLKKTTQNRGLFGACLCYCDTKVVPQKKAAEQPVV